MKNTFDVIVIGAGHAGCEAAYAAAQLGARVAICTLSTDTVAHMPCNPALGGTAKGHLVREIDALGGLMGRAIDATGIQFKLLNRSRGPAVWSPRAQADKKVYGQWVKRALDADSRITWLIGKAGAVLVEHGRVSGLAMEDGDVHRCRTLVVTTGTFLNGQIQAIGPRYCPSLEDKIVRFPEKERHQIFLEPEGVDAKEIYVNGFSMSLPREVQLELVRALPGLHDAIMLRPGYAVEYDFIQPTELTRRLETKRIRGLFLAGQINGTSGYEEAAAQGLVAGINAAHAVRRGPGFELQRHEAYVGILVDDLITKGCLEP